MATEVTHVHRTDKKGDGFQNFSRLLEQYGWIRLTSEGYRALKPIVIETRVISDGEGLGIERHAYIKCSDITHD